MTTADYEFEKIAADYGCGSLRGMALNERVDCSDLLADVLSSDDEAKWTWLFSRGASLERVQTSYDKGGWCLMATAEGFGQCMRDNLPLPSWISAEIQGQIFSGKRNKDLGIEKRKLRAFICWRTAVLIRFEILAIGKTLPGLIRGSLWKIREFDNAAWADKLGTNVSPLLEYLAQKPQALALSRTSKDQGPRVADLAAQILRDNGLEISESTVRTDAKSFAGELAAATAAGGVLHSVGPPFLPTRDALYTLDWCDMNAALDLGLPVSSAWLAAAKRSKAVPMVDPRARDRHKAP